MENNGLVHLRCPYTVSETVKRLESDELIGNIAGVEGLLQSVVVADSEQPRRPDAAD